MGVVYLVVGECGSYDDRVEWDCGSVDVWDHLADALGDLERARSEKPSP